MGLETERVRKLVASAVQFSSTELWEAIGQLKQKANDRQADELIENRKAFARSLKVGDPIVVRSNNFRHLQYGEQGTITHIRLARAPKCAWVTANWGENHKANNYAYPINALDKPENVSKGEIDINRTVKKVFSSL